MTNDRKNTVVAADARDSHQLVSTIKSIERLAGEAVGELKDILHSCIEREDFTTASSICGYAHKLKTIHRVPRSIRQMF